MSMARLLQEGTPEGVLTVQNFYLSYHLVKRNLDSANVHVNGHLKQKIDTSKYPVLTTDRFLRAVNTLENANDSFMTRYRDNVMPLVLTLDTSDGQLHTEFLKAAGQVVDEIRWGRIASLFFLTSLLSERLSNEGQSAKIESMVKWLGQFLNDHVSYWIQQRGGWAAITDALATESVSKPPVKVKAATLTTESISKPPVKAKAAEVKGSWFTLAAIGLGALVVGSLAMKS